MITELQTMQAILVPTFIHVTSFGDLRTKDKSVFPLHDPQTQGLQGFEQVLLSIVRTKCSPLTLIHMRSHRTHPCSHQNNHPVALNQ